MDSQDNGTDVNLAMLSPRTMRSQKSDIADNQMTQLRNNAYQTIDPRSNTSLPNIFDQEDSVKINIDGQNLIIEDQQGELQMLNGQDQVCDQQIVYSIANSMNGDNTNAVIGNANSIIYSEAQIGISHKLKSSANMSKIFNVGAEGSNHSIAYQSRRNFQYDDEQSEDSDENAKHEYPSDSISQSVNQQGYKPNVRFSNYKDIFNNLIKTNNVNTHYPICSVMITYDSERAITVSKKSEMEYHVNMFDLETYENVFEEKIGGKKGDYIKLKEIEQDTTGKKYAMVYFNDGMFKIRTFARQERSNEEIEQNEFNINDFLQIDNHTMVYDGFPDPSITCTFVSEYKIYVNLYHNATNMHYHFIYDSQSFSSSHKNVVPIKLDANKKNFPYKCFYSEQQNQVFSFYRQGQAITVNPSNLGEFHIEKMIDMDLGQMYMVYGQALIARSSSEILFFKRITDDITGKLKWKIYHRIQARGFIYYIKGNIRIQVTTDEKIFFYIINQQTLKPSLENVMFNYMGCNHLMFGSKVQYGISYKTNEKSFQIYRRAYSHNFKVPILMDNLERSRAIELESLNIFLVTQIDKVLIYDSETFEKMGSLPIKLLKTNTREINEIISIQNSEDDQYVAVISGKNLVGGMQKMNQLFIFQKTRDQRQVNFQLISRVVLKDIEAFKSISRDFYFYKKDGSQRKNILFCKNDCIFTLNFITSQLKTIYRFREELGRQPEFFNPNDDQTIFVCASSTDGIYVNIHKNQEYDIDEKFQIAMIKEIIYDVDDKCFYILSNKYQEKLGFYVLQFFQEKPQNSKFLIKFKNKLDIDDCYIAILRDQTTNIKEIVIGLKSIFINTYSVFVMDLTTKIDQNLIFRFEAFQLWESECCGLILNKNKEYLMINGEGIQIIGLGPKDKRAVRDHQGNDRILHGLEGYNYLKLESKNNLFFKCQKYSERTIQVQQEYEKENSIFTDGSCNHGETEFEQIFNIKIWEITLRELLLFNSLYVSKTQSNIVDLVNDQPNPKVFYKSFLEFDGTNMVSILSFDSRSMQYLLSDKFSEYYSTEYPIFYKNKIQKGHIKEDRSYYRNAIDNALRNNQIKAVQCIIEYIIRYQNNFASSYLFLKIFPLMLEKGVECYSLLCSNVFQYEFDYDEWPGTHTDDTEYERPYNESIFYIRKHYKTVFPETNFNKMIDDEGHLSKMDSSKIYKIKYQINLLPKIGVHHTEDESSAYSTAGKPKLVNTHIDWMEMLQSSNQLDIFKAKAILPFVKFKWQRYGMQHHIYGLTVHFLQVLILIIYVDKIYIDNALNIDKTTSYWESDKNYVNYWALTLMIGTSHTIIYESIQMWRQGITKYLRDLQNWLDMLYIIFCILTSFHHIQYHPFTFESKLFIIISCLMNTLRSFKYLRIFECFSPIVYMLSKVLIDLQIFLFFYVILIAFFSLIMGVIGLSNARYYINEEYYRYSFQCRAAIAEQDVVPRICSYAGSEYYNVGNLVGNFIDTFRISLGDYSSVSSSMYLRKNTDNYLFWFMWFTIVFIGCIIFLNFVIAEACHSYEVVVENLAQYICKQRAKLISEAEGMCPDSLKSLNDYPQYIIIRSVDD